MADGIEFKLTGIEQLVATMNDVQYETKRKGGRFALRKAAQVIRDQARSNAEKIDDPRSPENISLNIVERWSGRRFRRTGDLMFRVGVLGGARARTNGGSSGNPGGDTFYWRFVEFGTERGGPDRVGARPFMRPSVDQAGQRAVNTFITEYQKALDRAIKRAQRQGTQA